MLSVKKMKKPELVFIPCPGISHLMPTIEMAKLLIDHHEELSIRVLLIELPFDTTVSNYVKSLSQASTSRITFIELPVDSSTSEMKSANPFRRMLMVLERQKPNVRDALAEISTSASHQLTGIVIDMFCTTMTDIVNDFGVPTYLFYTSSAATLGLAFHLQSLRDDCNQEPGDYKDANLELTIPTYINPVPTKLLPSVFFDKVGSKSFLDHAKRFRETKGIIINTFLELESHAVNTLSKDMTIPPVYTVGPLLNFKGITDKNHNIEMIMKWLDLQANSSLVFLCFGNYGCFKQEQVKEIAYALENSGYNFLWSLRRPPSADKTDVPDEYEKLEEMLPEGFLERTAHIGKVIGWAPQVAVLSHPAVGGFVSHCGWNSVLESVWFGVPMATWPLYAEQQVNAFEMVKDLGLAVEMKMDYISDSFGSSSIIIKADEIKEGIKRLMDPDNEVRILVKKMKEKSRLALKEGESSYVSLKCFLQHMDAGKPVA